MLLLPPGYLIVENGLQPDGQEGVFGNVCVVSQGFHCLGLQPGLPMDLGEIEPTACPLVGFAEHHAMGDRHLAVVPGVPPAIAERPLTANITGAAAKPA